MRSGELNLISYPCRLDEFSTRRTAIFDCLDVRISIDRHNPLVQASYRPGTRSGQLQLVRIGR